MRKIFLLRNLPRHPRKIDTKTLQQRCADDGFVTSLRTIQRDLNELSLYFPLLTDDASPQGWSLSANEPLDIPAIDLSTAVSFALAEEHLSSLLPLSMRERLAPHFTQARRFLAAEASNPVCHWPQKVKVLPRGLALKPALIDSEVSDTVYSALLHERALEIRYRSRSTGETRQYTVHPHGLVSREGISYLIACFDGYDDMRQLALSRICEARELEQPATLSSGFELDTYIEQGGMNVLHSRQPLHLKLLIADALYPHLSETPLADDQSIEQRDGRWLLSVTVADSGELRWWLLGLGAQVEVLAPAALRNELSETIGKMAAQYAAISDKHMA